MASNRKKAPLVTASVNGLDRKPVLGTEEVTFLRQSLFSPLRNFTPQRLVQLLEEREAGFLYECLRVWEAMAKRDDVIVTVKGKSEDAVAQRQWSTLETSAVADDRSLVKIADDQKAQLRFFWNNVTVRNVWDRNDTGGFTAFVRLAMQAKAFGHGAFHFAWKPSPKGLTAELEYVPGWMFENTSGELRYLGTQIFGIYGDELNAANWQTFCGKGLMEPASIAYAYKHLGLDTWLQYCDRWAGGVPVGKTSAAPNSTEWNTLKTAVKGIRRDRGAIIGNGAELTMLETSGSGVTPSQALVERIDRALSSMFRGGDLSTMSSSAGQGTGSNQQTKEALLIEAADCQWISELMQRIERRVIAWHHGADAECLAYTVIKGPNLADIDTEMKVDEAGLKMGVKLSKSDWLERYQRTEADTEQDALNAPQAAPAAAPALAANSNDHHDVHGRFTSGDGSGGVMYASGHKGTFKGLPHAEKIFHLFREAGAPPKEVHAYGSQLVSKFYSEDAARKAFGLLKASGWQVKQPTKSLDDAIENKGTNLLPTKTEVWLVGARRPIQSAVNDEPFSGDSSVILPPSSLPRDAVRRDLQPVRDALATVTQTGTPPTDAEWDAFTDQVLASGHLEDAIGADWFRTFADANGLSPGQINDLIAQALRAAN